MEKTTEQIYDELLLANSKAIEIRALLPDATSVEIDVDLDMSRNNLDELESKFIDAGIKTAYHARMASLCIYMSHCKVTIWIKD